MYGQRFYNETTRKYVAMFGTLFNDIVISRKDGSGAIIQSMKVPINYAPMQKILAKIEGDPNLNAPAMTLPRMSFEIVGMSYNPERKLTSLRRLTSVSTGDANSMNSQYVPAPFDISFQLNIMTKYNEDGVKILEQIIPYFKPDITPSVRLIDELDLYVDIPIILTGISMEDTYEAGFEQRRSLIWTLDFTVKAYYFGPTTTKKVIKFTEVNLYDNFDETTGIDAKVTIQPGMTADNEPTTDVSQSISYDLIDEDDNWGYIVTIEEFE